MMRRESLRSARLPKGTGRHETVGRYNGAPRGADTSPRVSAANMLGATGFFHGLLPVAPSAQEGSGVMVLIEHQDGVR